MFFYPDTKKLDLGVFLQLLRYGLLNIAEKLRKYRILMVPRQLHICNMILEQEGVLGNTVLIEDLHIDFIPLDSDIISLENPQLLNAVFRVSWLVF